MNFRTSFWIAILSVVFTSCTQHTVMRESVWTPNAPGPAPDIRQDVRFGGIGLETKTRTEKILRIPLRLDDVEVEGAFAQSVENSRGEIRYTKVRFPENNLAAVKKEIAKWRPQWNSIEKGLLSPAGHDAPFLSFDQVLGSRFVVATVGMTPHFAADLIFIDSKKTGVYRYRYIFATHESSIRRVSSAFADGKAMVYPMGPKVSILTEKPLLRLSGDGSLTKSNLAVLPQIEDKAMNVGLIFNYDPQDEKFDQVQAFYYADEALTFFRDKLGVTLPPRLEVLTEYGAPEKLNAMFYYQNKVHLGIGDGISYHNIPRDPSIVIHEAAHALIEAVANLPMGEGEGGSLNEGFADFFAASYLNDPNLGEVAYLPGPFKRTIDNKRALSSKNGGLYADSLILSGTFWEIRQAIGVEKSLDLAMKTLARLGPSGTFSNIHDCVLAAIDNSFNEQDKDHVVAILKERGF